MKDQAFDNIFETIHTLKYGTRCKKRLCKQAVVHTRHEIELLLIKENYGSFLKRHNDTRKSN